MYFYYGTKLQIVSIVSFEVQTICILLDDTSADDAAGDKINAHARLPLIALDDRGATAAQKQAGHLTETTSTNGAATISVASSPSSSVAISATATATATTSSSSQSPTNDEIDGCDSLMAAAAATDGGMAKQSLVRSAGVEGQASVESLLSAGDRRQPSSGSVPQHLRDKDQLSRESSPVATASSANVDVERGRQTTTKLSTNDANRRDEVDEQNKRAHDALQPAASAGVPDRLIDRQVFDKRSSRSVDGLSAEVARESQRRTSELHALDGRGQAASSSSANRETAQRVGGLLAASNSMKLSSSVAHARMADSAAGSRPISAADLLSARHQASISSSRRTDESPSLDGSSTSEDVEGRRMVIVSRSSIVERADQIPVTSSRDVNSSIPRFRFECSDSQQSAIDHKKSTKSSGIKSAGHTRVEPVNRQPKATDDVDSLQYHPHRTFPGRSDDFDGTRVDRQFEKVNDDEDKRQRQAFGVSREQASTADGETCNYNVNLVLPAQSVVVRSPPSSVMSSSFSPTSLKSVVPPPAPFLSTVHHVMHSEWGTANNAGDLNSEVTTPTRSFVAPQTPASARHVATVRVGSGSGDVIAEQPT
jgi:hypothetical protein